MSSNVAPRPQLAHLTAQLEELKQRGTYFRLRVLDDQQEAVCTYDGKRVINLASNNYLGLATHPKLREAAIAAIRKYGVGSGAVRTIAGTMRIHMELEEKIARFKNVEACVVFQSGFTANAGTVSAILGKEDFIISDELNHASIIDGARLSRAKIKVFRHKDMAHAEELLQEVQHESGRKLLITDGVFSMDGDIARLPDIVTLAGQYGAMTYVDDAHSSGVLGKNGRGSVNHFGLDGQVDVQVGTLSKAMGVLGGYVASTRTLIEMLWHRGRPFLFSTSHPPGVAAACIAAIDVMLDEPELIDRLWDNSRYFKAGLTELGFNTGRSETPITPVIVGEGSLAMTLSDRLFQAGVFAQGIAFPTVAKDKARVRTIVSATHTRQDLDEALAAFAQVGRELGIIPS